MSALLTGCSDGKKEAPQLEGEGKTVLVYMAANNSLSPNAQLDIAEMRSAVTSGALQGGRLLLLTSTPSHPGPQLQEMTTNGLKLLCDYPEYNTAISATLLSQSISDARRLTGCHFMGLVLWSHATGWPDKRNTPSLRWWGYDHGASLTIAQLSQALEGTNLDFIYCDCCFMGSVEVVYALRNATPYIIASPTETPADGMPYDKNLQCFFSQPMNLQQAVENTYNYYLSQSDPELRSISISLFRTSQISALYEGYEQMLTHGVPNLTDIPQYGFNIYGTDYSGKYYDLYDLTMQQLPNEAERMAFARQFSQAVMLNYHTSTMWGRFSLVDTHGLACSPNYH